MKKLFTVLGLASLVFLISYVFNKNLSEVSVSLIEEDSSIILSEDDDPYFSKDTLGKKPIASIDRENLNPSGTFEKINRERDRLKKIGYYTPDEEAVYQSYSVNVLEELLFSGDIYAYPPLVDKYLEEKDREKVIVAARIAAVYGSTPAIIMSASQELGIAQIAARQGDNERAYHHAVISKGLFRLATLLGDPHAQDRSDMSFSKSDIELSEEHMIQAELAADKFRGELNELRRRQGLDAL